MQIFRLEKDSAPPHSHFIYCRSTQKRRYAIRQARHSNNFSTPQLFEIKEKGQIRSIEDRKDIVRDTQDTIWCGHKIITYWKAAATTFHDTYCPRSPKISDYCRSSLSWPLRNFQVCAYAHAFIWYFNTFKWMKSIESFGSKSGFICHKISFLKAKTLLRNSQNGFQTIEWVIENIRSKYHVQWSTAGIFERENRRNLYWIVYRNTCFRNV